MRGFIVLIYIFTYSHVALAAEDIGSLENKFSGSVELGGYKTSGNTNTETFDGKLELGHKLGDWSSKFTVKASQVAEDEIITSSYYEAVLKSIYDLPKHFYTFLQLGYREDTFGGVYYEQSYIGGLGYRAFTEEPAYDLDFELGYGQRVTKKLVDGVIRDRLDYDPGTHLAIIGQYNFSEDDTVKVNLSGEFGNDDDYIKKEIAWEHKFFETLHADISYEARTLTAPGVNKVRTDDKISMKLGYDF